MVVVVMKRLPHASIPFHSDNVYSSSHGRYAICIVYSTTAGIQKINTDTFSMLLRRFWGQTTREHVFSSHQTTTVQHEMWMSIENIHPMCLGLWTQLILLTFAVRHRERDVKDITPMIRRQLWPWQSCKCSDEGFPGKFELEKKSYSNLHKYIYIFK